VSEDESQAGLGQKFFVDGFELVRQCADARQRNREVRVIVKGQPDARRFEDMEDVTASEQVSGGGSGPGEGLLQVADLQGDVL